MFDVAGLEGEHDILQYVKPTPYYNIQYLVDTYPWRIALEIR
jgi:hypothetical protein